MLLTAFLSETFFFLSSRLIFHISSSVFISCVEPASRGRYNKSPFLVVDYISIHQSCIASFTLSLVDPVLSGGTKRGRRKLVVVFCVSIHREMAFCLHLLCTHTNPTRKPTIIVFRWTLFSRSTAISISQRRVRPRISERNH
jgi:hypothetical protein